MLRTVQCCGQCVCGYRSWQPVMPPPPPLAEMQALQPPCLALVQEEWHAAAAFVGAKPGGAADAHPLLHPAVAAAKGHQQCPEHSREPGESNGSAAMSANLLTCPCAELPVCHVLRVTTSGCLLHVLPCPPVVWLQVHYLCVLQWHSG